MVQTGFPLFSRHSNQLIMNFHYILFIVYSHHFIFEILTQCTYTCNARTWCKTGVNNMHGLWPNKQNDFYHYSTSMIIKKQLTSTLWSYFSLGFGKYFVCAYRWYTRGTLIFRLPNTYVMRSRESFGSYTCGIFSFLFDWGPH